MPRFLRRHTIADTREDRTGDRIPPEVLRQLFDQLGEETPSGANHDLSRAPMVRFLNKHLVESADGELAIVADVEILDEEAFSKMGGFSISFTRTTVRFGRGEPAIEVQVNPRQFHFETVVGQVEAVAHAEPAIDATELVQKAEIVETAIITLVVFGATELAGGFFKAAGAELYERLRSLRRIDQPSRPHTIQLHLYVLAPRQNVLANIVLVPEPAATGSAVAAIDLGKLGEKVDTYEYLPRVIRFLGRLPASGEPRLVSAYLTGGQVVKLERERGDV